MALSMRVGHVIPPTHFGHDRHTDRHISREISIEHPSVGLTSLAQLYRHLRCLFKTAQLTEVPASRESASKRLKCNVFFCFFALIHAQPKITETVKSYTLYSGHFWLSYKF